MNIEGRKLEQIYERRTLESMQLSGQTVYIDRIDTELKLNLLLYTEAFKVKQCT